MIRKIVVVALASAHFAVPLPAAAKGQNMVLAPSAPRLFSTEFAAQKLCRDAVVVWLSTHTRTYHEKGMPCYCRTNSGAFVCRKDTDAADDRDTRNGQ